MLIELVTMFPHFIGFVLTIVLAFIAIKIGKLTGFVKDWTYMALGFVLLSIARTMYFICDFSMFPEWIYYIGIFFGTIGIILELISLILIYKRLKRMKQ